MSAVDTKFPDTRVDARVRRSADADNDLVNVEDDDVVRCFVQFIHDGPEHKPDSPGAKSWNVGGHKRKFLRSSGEYVADADDAVVKGELAFWGEWEAESEVEKVGPPRVPHGPEWLHTPYYVRPESYRDLQNTDPFVFGDRFLYTLCKQSKQSRPTFLRDLAPGSLILFGSHKAGEFVLDTAFVVADGVLHDSDTWPSALRGRISQTYEDVTIRPTYEDPVAHELRLYTGATQKEPMHGMFSFAPCLPFDVDRVGFARPSIQLQGVNPDLTQGMKGAETTSLSVGEIKKRWDAVVKQVLDQGLALGTRFALPPRRERFADNSSGTETRRVRSSC